MEPKAPKVILAHKAQKANLVYILAQKTQETSMMFGLIQKVRLLK